MNLQKRRFLSKAFEIGGLSALISLGLSYKAASSFAGILMQMDSGKVVSDAICIGWDAPSCSPSTVPTSSSAQNDQIVTTKWTATENGTAKTINFYVGASWDAVQDYTAVVLFRDKAGTITLVGQGNIDETIVSTNTFHGKVTLIAEGGETLTFSTNDDLYFGVLISGNADSSIGREDTGGSGMYFDFADAYSGGPPATTTFSLSSGREMAITLEYE